MEVTRRYKLHCQTLFKLSILFSLISMITLFTVFLLLLLLTLLTLLKLFSLILSLTLFTLLALLQLLYEAVLINRVTLIVGLFLHSELFPRKFSISSQSGWQAGTTNVTLLGNTGLYWAVTDSPRLY